MALHQASAWIPPVIASAVCAGMHLYILIMDNSSKKAHGTVFINRWMKVLPTVTIVSGMIQGLVGSIAYFQYICNVAHLFGTIATSTQIVSMGFYQLSRLNYCFSQSKVSMENKYRDNLMGIQEMTHAYIYFPCLIY